jgi:hypothetical protein
MFDTCIVRTGELFGPDTEPTVVAIQTRPAFQKAQLSESLGATPVMVLTRGIDAGPSLPPTSNPNEIIQRQLWMMHAEVAASSSRGVHWGAPGSEHDIQLDNSAL